MDFPATSESSGGYLPWSLVGDVLARLGYRFCNERGHAVPFDGHAVGILRERRGGELGEFEFDLRKLWLGSLEASGARWRFRAHGPEAETELGPVLELLADRAGAMLFTEVEGEYPRLEAWLEA